MSKFKKCYSQEDGRLLQLMRELVITPLATCLLFAFLFANAIFVYAEFRLDHQSENPSQVNLYAFEGQNDLIAVQVESSDLRFGRAGAEHLFAHKLKIRNTHVLVGLQTPSGLSGQPFPVDIFSPYTVSFHAAPFSPRPPPFPLAQA